MNSDGPIVFQVELDRLNAVLARSGKDFRVTEEDLRSAGMESMPARLERIEIRVKGGDLRVGDEIVVDLATHTVLEIRPIRVGLLIVTVKANHARGVRKPIRILVDSEYNVSRLES